MSHPNQLDLFLQNEPSLEEFKAWNFRQPIEIQQILADIVAAERVEEIISESKFFRYLHGSERAQLQKEKMAAPGLRAALFLCGYDAEKFENSLGHRQKKNVRDPGYFSHPTLDFGGEA